MDSVLEDNTLYTNAEDKLGGIWIQRWNMIFVYEMHAMVYQDAVLLITVILYVTSSRYRECEVIHLYTYRTITTGTCNACTYSVDTCVQYM